MAVLAIAGTLCARAFDARGVNWSAILAAWAVLFFAGNLLARPSGNLYAGTLTVSEILTDILQAFKTQLPALHFFSTDFSKEQVKFGQQIIAHLPIVPTAFDHVAANGYNSNAQNARDLLSDVAITMDQWKDVPIKIQAADASQDRNQNYLKTIGNAGYVLAKAVVDYALTKVLVANFSKVTIESIANTSKETLGKVRIGLNGVKALTPRYMLGNSDFVNALDSDPRITSRDWYGQKSDGNPYLMFQNLAGFNTVMEYPDFPATGNLSAFGFDQRAIAVATRLPMDSTDLARQLGIPVTYTAETIQDPDTGLAIVAFSWIDPNTHYIYITASVMYGAVAGSQGGAAGAKTDYAGWRVVTA